MKVKIIIAIVLVALLSLMGILYFQSTGKNSSIYYVDSINGNDNNNGTSSSRAWKTLEKVNNVVFASGDKILFKAGCNWTGVLSPKGSGTADSSIVIDMYGEGNKPVINGTGKNESSAVTLTDQEYWEINNLKVTNPGSIAGGEKRRGFYISATAEAWPSFTSKDAPKILNHIVIQNCEIADVNSTVAGMDSPSKCWGGIIFKVSSKEESTSWVKFNDILVSNNYIHDTSRNGFYNHNDFCINTPYTQRPDQTSSGGEGTRPNLPWTKVVLRNNYCADLGGDGLVVTSTIAPLIEKNVVARPQRQPGDGLFAVGIWVFNCIDGIIQYNESFGNQTANDGQGFDADFACKGTAIQYNYSHDNEGGFVLVCSGPGTNENPIVRYNVSQNDGGAIGGRVFQVSGGGTINAKFYNNTIYTSETTQRIVDSGTDGWCGSPVSATYDNNIIYSRNANATNNLTDASKFNNNCFYNCEVPPSSKNSITMDPKFVNPGSGTTGERVDQEGAIGNVDGYKLQSGSPCIDKGLVEPDNGGKDYWGNILYNNAPDIGAFEFNKS